METSLVLQYTVSICAVFRAMPVRDAGNVLSSSPVIGATLPRHSPIPSHPILSLRHRPTSFSLSTPIDNDNDSDDKHLIGLLPFTLRRRDRLADMAGASAVSPPPSHHHGLGHQQSLSTPPEHLEPSIHDGMSPILAVMNRPWPSKKTSAVLPDFMAVQVEVGKVGKEREVR
jgi:hypothetical protein